LNQKKENIAPKSQLKAISKPPHSDLQQNFQGVKKVSLSLMTPTI